MPYSRLSVPEGRPKEATAVQRKLERESIKSAESESVEEKAPSGQERR